MSKEKHNRKVTLGPQFFINVIEENLDKNEKDILKKSVEDMWGVEKSW